MKRITAIILLGFTTGTLALAQGGVQDLTPVKIAIFKNATYFVKQNADVAITNGQFSIPPPEKVLMGTYWVTTNKDAPIKSITIGKDTTKVVLPATTFEEYLTCLVGQRITFKEKSIYNTTLQGTLVSFDRSS